MKNAVFAMLTAGLTLLGACSTRTAIGGLGDAGADVSTGGSVGGGTGGHAGAGGVVGSGGAIGAGTGGHVGAGGNVGPGGNGAFGGNVGSGGVVGSGGNTGSGGNGGFGGGAVVCNGTGGRPPLTLSFEAARTFIAGPAPTSIAIGDLTFDGKPDLAVGNSDGHVSILTNDGNSNFNSRVSLAVGTSSPLSIALGDLNGDGHLDLVVVSPNVSVLLSGPAGTFGAAMNYTVGTFSSSAAIGDLNRDGRTDLAVANYGDDRANGDVGVLLNNGGGTTFSAANYPAGTHPNSIVMGDLNGDGLPDLAIADGLGGVNVLRSNCVGCGQFMDAIGFGAGTRPTSVAIGELNGDCSLDLALASGSGNVSVLLNRGNDFSGRLDFAVAVNYGGADLGANSVAIGDMNGDGMADLVAANPCCGVAVLLNNGNGIFAAPINYPAGTLPGSIALGDLNGDGKLDVAAAFSSGVSVLLNTSH